LTDNRKIFGISLLALGVAFGSYVVVTAYDPNMTDQAWAGGVALVGLVIGFPIATIGGLLLRGGVRMYRAQRS
jgi:hypothetical protein